MWLVSLAMCSACTQVIASGSENTGQAARAQAEAGPLTADTAAAPAAEGAAAVEVADVASQMTASPAAEEGAAGSELHSPPAADVKQES